MNENLKEFFKDIGTGLGAILLILGTAAALIGAISFIVDHPFIGTPPILLFFCWVVGGSIRN